MPRMIEKTLEYIDVSIRWNMVLRYFTQIYVPLLLSILLMKNHLSFSFEDEIPYEAILWICILAVLVFIPFMSFLLMLDAQHKLTPTGRVNELNLNHKQRKYGTFWLDLDTSRIAALTYQLITFARRFILVMTVAFVDDMAIQLIFLSIVSILLIIYLFTVKPMSTMVK